MQNICSQKSVFQENNGKTQLPQVFLEHILQVEGGYVNAPGDPGGETNLGITAATLRKARATIPELPESVRELTPQDASIIYARLYLLPARCHLLPWPLNLYNGPRKSDKKTGEVKL